MTGATGSELTHESFDRISWHDATLYGLSFRVGDPERDDWTSDLVLDLDFIVEWLREGDTMRFRVAPATLVFHGVTDLSVGIASGTEGHQVSLVRPSIASIEREPVAEQRVFLDRPYYQWRVRLNGTPDGELRFGAVGFTQSLRREPSLCDQQWLPAELREES